MVITSVHRSRNRIPVFTGIETIEFAINPHFARLCECRGYHNQAKHIYYSNCQDRNQKMQNRLELYLPGLGLESESTKTPSGFVDIYFKETLITITDHA